MGAGPPKAAGSYGLLDVICHPGRLAQLPPEPSESFADVRAVDSGEARRVWCWLGERRGDGWGRPRQDHLELSQTSCLWYPWPSFGVRKPRDLDITGVVLVRRAEHSDDGRFARTVNMGLSSLVLCATPAGRLELFVPTADVPLVGWCFGGNAEALAESSGRYLKRPQFLSKRQARLRAVSGLALGVIAMLVMPTSYGPLGMIPLFVGGFLITSAVLRQRFRR